MKKLNRNSLEKYIKLNKGNCIKSNNAQGITLIALIVTIVVMIVIAGVAINMTIGENGIFTKAVKAKEMQETAAVKEKLELKQVEASVALGGGSLTLEDYLKYLVDQGMIDESDIEDTADDNVKTILVDNKYIYTVVKKDDGSIGLEYEGKAGKLLPKIKSVNTKSTTSSIEVKVDATRVDGGEYRFYIKDVASGEDYKKKQTNKTGEYTFTGLEQNKEFKVKVEVENKNGIAEKETSIIRTVTVAELTQSDLEFTYNPNDWTKDKIVVTVNAKVEIPTGYTLQTSKDMTKWENTTTQEFTENGYMYVRLFDGTNGGSYAVGEVTKIDTEKPKVTTSSSTSNSITFSGTDNASGIIGYAVTTTKVEPTNFVAVDNTKALNNITIGERSQKTEYYVWLKDKAENVSEPVTIKTDEATGITQADINFTYSPSEWTNGKVTVTASLKTTIPTGYTLQTSKTATNWENKMAQEFTANGYIYVRLFDGTNGGSYAVGEVTKIDTEKPKVTTTSSTSNSITFSGTDNASGIIGYKVTTSNTEPTSFDSCTSTTALNNKQVTGLTANTTYYIWLKDAAGNISEAKTEKTPVTLVTSITLNKTTLTLDKGSKETLTATVNPTNATNKEITWSTNKSSVATVSTTGEITAVAAGTATITATAKDGSGKSASCTVTVKEKTTKDLKAGDYIKYNTGVNSVGTNGIVTCRVLYDASSEYGLQLITDKNIVNVTLEADDWTTARNSYNNAITILNNEAGKYLNKTYATDARCVGSVPTNKNGTFINKNSENVGPQTFRYFSTSVESANNMKAADTNYKTDITQMESLNILTTGKNYWIASRFVNDSLSFCDLYVHRVMADGNFSQMYLCRVKSDSAYGFSSTTYGLRPCFSLKSDIKITRGNGTSESPYTM